MAQLCCGVVIASNLATIDARRQRLALLFSRVGLTMAVFFGPYSLWMGRTLNTAYIATCAALLLCAIVYAGRRPTSNAPALVFSFAANSVLLVGMWNSGGAESAAVAWLPVGFVLLGLLLPLRAAVPAGVLYTAAIAATVWYAPIMPVVERTSIDTFVDLMGASLSMAFLAYIFLQHQRGSELALQALVDDLTAEVDARTAAEQEATLASRVKSRFLATVSHELRTPLNGVIGMADLLAQTCLTDEQREMVTLIDHSGDLLNRVIDDTLTFTAMEAEGADLHPSAVSLRHILRETTVLLSAAAKARGRNQVPDVRGHVDAAVPEWVIADGDRLQQILYNLGGNALKFTEAGAVTLAIQRAEHGIELRVTDQGPGIPPTQVERIFEAFVQLDDSDRRKHGGAGLGLAIVHGLVDAMQGTIAVESVMGEGSTFIVTLPLPATEDPHLATPDAAAHAQPSGTVLVVEDNAINARVVGAMLDSFGLGWAHAISGREALNLAQEQDWGLVLTDLQMPEMDGIDTARALRQQGYTGPILALTADALPEDRQRCLDAGMQDHLSKPLRRVALQRALTQWLPERSGVDI
ncbi:MAG: ATP-binding protein [Myxococcota bacterium]